MIRKNGLDEMLCQEQKSAINAIKSRNFAIDFVKKPYYNGRRNFEKGTNRIVKRTYFFAWNNSLRIS